MVEHTEFRKYGKIPYLGESEIKLDSEDNEVYEKIDGSNCQVRLIKGRIRTGSRSKFVDTRPWNTIFWFPDFIKWANSQKGLYFLPKNFVVYGEWTTEAVKSIQQITYPRQFRNRFFLIDVFDLNTDKFLDYEDGVKLVRDLGVGSLFLDPLCKGPIDKGKLEVLLRTPSFFRNGKDPLEGVVIKDYRRQTFAKELNPEFSEIRRGAKTETEMYVTKGRVVRIMKALREDNIEPIPTVLTEELIKDIMQEHCFSLNTNDVLEQLERLNLR